MEALHESYRKVLGTSLRVGWRLEDVLPDGARLDLTRPMLPESLAGVGELTFLSEDERLTLNHIRGHSYLRLFGLVEEFILPFVVDHARSRFGADDHEVRALLQFAAEEAKHIHLFKRFADRFREDFPVPCDVIGPPEAIAREVLKHDPVGVGLIILHIEWMTQRHYVDSVRDEAELDPLFASLLRHHWIEEAQHAKLDDLIVRQIASRSTPADVEQGLSDYHRIVRLLADGLDGQVELDLDALQRAIGRILSDGERERVREAQRAAYRWTFLETGATHPRFLATYDALERGAMSA